MGCDHPLNGYYSTRRGPSGKRLITFNRNEAFSPSPMKLPCGRCMGCRLEHSRQWAVRCMHESKLYGSNEFVTLTYDNANLPRGGTLVRRDPQLFLKRLRKELVGFDEVEVDGERCRPIRFYGCGEYGELSGRPHYHIILFNLFLKDKKFLKMAKNGVDKLYCSDVIRKLWPFGNNVIGSVSFDTCSYVARYVTVKLNGDKEVEYDLIMSDGEVIRRLPEFSMMSRRPGIGAGWFAKYGVHAYQFDSVIMNEREVRPPRYYDGKYEAIDSDHLLELKLERKRRALSKRDDNTSARRHVKEDVLRLNMKRRDGDA